MVSVNLIFHVVSAITFVLLIWYLLNLQAQVAFLRELLGSLTQPQAKVKVDWPEAFLKRFAAVQGLGFESDGKKLPPQKIDMRLWAEAQRELGIEAIRWSVPRLGLQVGKEADLNAWATRLEASFQGKISIEWSSAKSPSKG